MISKAALDKVIHGTPAERTYLCGRDFALFFVYYAVDYIKYPFAPFHYEMFSDARDLMEGKYREVAWVMFRESAKTSIAKMFLLWLICYKKRSYINVDSFDKENSERILFDIVVELQTNPRIRQDFGELFNSTRDAGEKTQKRISNFLTNNGIRVEAHSTQESVRGRIHGHQRPDFLLLDDFETNKTKDSKAYTEQVIKHIDEFKAGLDSTARILYLGNYITEYGSLQTILDRAREDERLLVRRVDVSDRIAEDATPSWPAKYTWTREEGKVDLWDKLKQLGSQVFMTEMMNSPIDEGTQEFRKSMFRYRTMAEVTGLPVRKFATIDSALTRGAKSDFTGVTKNWVHPNNDWNVSSRGYKISSKDVIDLIFRLHEEGFEKIGIEEGAFSQAIEPFFQDECRKRNKFPYVVMLKHGGTMKETRIRGLIPRYEAGSIFHIEGECADLEDQLLRFPRGMHDDCPDSLAYQLGFAEPPYPQEDYEEEEAPLYPDIGI